MKAALQVKLSQHLTLTPQLQQAIKLLQLSTVELEQEVERYINENPLLERDEPEYATTPMPHEGQPVAGEAEPATATALSEMASAESLDDGLPAEYGSRSGDGNGDDEAGIEPQTAAEIGLQQHLINQLCFLPLTPRDRQLAAMVVAQLDDDGYLFAEVDELMDLADHDALPDAGTPLEPEEFAVAIMRVQQLDPTGVGARSLPECLELQLRTQPASAARDTAIKLVREHLAALASRDFATLKRALRLRDAELKEVQSLITQLDPKPGRRFSHDDVRYVVPDVLVKRVQGRWKAVLNQDAVPKLRINSLYASLVHKSRETDGKNLSGQLQEARWLLKNIQQRFETILKVTQAIVENQRHFFDHGEVAMRPLVLKEIADQVGLHESTISRVTTQKYMLTPRGIYELKYFFGSSVATDTGGACSATAIRAMIKQLVDAEDRRKPLSDNSIADLLSDQGIIVARRTIAKYRESLQIQPASQRKAL